MNVLHISTPLSWRGGEQQLLYLNEGLRKRGINSFVACPKKSVLFRKLQSQKYPVFPINIKYEYAPIPAFNIYKIIKSENIDIINYHDAHSLSMNVILSTLFKIKIRRIYTRRVDFHIRLASPLTHLKYFHNLDKIIAISNGIKKVLLSDGIPDEKIEIIHSGIDLERLSNSTDTAIIREFNIRKDEIILGNVAALAPHKDQATLLKAFKKVITKIHNCRLFIIGTGVERKNLEQNIKNLNLVGKVCLTGFRNDIGAFYKRMDIFVSSSYLEGLGTSTLDAMSCGLPIVATNTGGIPEIVHNNENGILVNPYDDKGLASAIIKLMQNKPLRMEFSKKSLEIVKSFSKEKMIDLTLQLYQQLKP